MSTAVESLYYPEGGESPLRRVLLAPLALVALGFRAGVAARGLAYARGWAGATRVPGLRVVSVGNLTVGGAGKTPVVRALAERLVRAGERVAILSRGHGRTSDVDVRVEGPPWPDVSRCGDEPLLLAHALPDVTVWVGADRARLAARAARCGATVALLDDGFQHRRLARDLDVVVVDEAVGLGNGHLLPRGPLREPPSALARAGLLWVRVAEGGARGPEVPWPEHVPRVRARHAPADVVLPGGEVAGTDALRGRPVLGFAGIARPEAFRRTLLALGAELVAFRAFPDHHAYDATTWAALARDAAAAGALAVTTEKDAVRLPGDAAVAVVRQSVTVLDGEEALARALARSGSSAPTVG